MQESLTDIKNSLTTGTDLTEGLKVTLKDMADDHLDKIAAYGKKLNPMTVFYMIFGTIVPALGMAIGTIAISFLPNFQLGVPQVIVIGFVIILIQLFFITLFKSYQPNIDL